MHALLAEPGARRRFVFVSDTARNGLSSQFTGEVDVLRRERVRVPAGEFDTLVVHVTWRNGTCVETQTGWLDAASMVPVSGEHENRGCANPAVGSRQAAAVRPARTETAAAPL
jgi:hypothetical protein